MKRGTPRHPKTLEFVERLDQRPRSLACAIGYLELLFHFTAEFAPQGDIGRYSDDRIEAALDWSGRRGRLLGALRESGWIDECPISRLVVHDWHDHCEDSVRKRIQRSGLSFLSVTDKLTGHRQTLSATQSENVCLPLPLPLPSPSPEPSQVGAACESMYALHPKKKDLPLLPEALENSCKVKPLAEIMRVHALWCGTEDWRKNNGRFAPSLPQWLVDRGYTQEPLQNGAEPQRKLNLYTGPAPEVEGGL